MAYTEKIYIFTPGVLLNNVGVSTSTNPWEKTGNVQWVFQYINRCMYKYENASVNPHHADCKGTPSFSSPFVISVLNCTASWATEDQDTDTASGGLQISSRGT